MFLKFFSKKVLTKGENSDKMYKSSARAGGERTLKIEQRWKVRNPIKEIELTLTPRSEENVNSNETTGSKELRGFEWLRLVHWEISD